MEGKPAGNLTRDSILDNITLYWLTGTGASAARWYWEAGQAAARAAGKSPPAVAVPVGFTTFPAKSCCAPKLGRDYVPGLAYSARSNVADISPPGRSRSCFQMEGTRSLQIIAQITDQRLDADDVEHARQIVGQRTPPSPWRPSAASCTGSSPG